MAAYSSRGPRSVCLGACLGAWVRAACLPGGGAVLVCFAGGPRVKLTGSCGILEISSHLIPAIQRQKSTAIGIGINSTTICSSSSTNSNCLTLAISSHNYLLTREQP